MKVDCEKHLASCDSSSSANVFSVHGLTVAQEVRVSPHLLFIGIGRCSDAAPAEETVGQLLER